MKKQSPLTLKHLFVLAYMKGYSEGQKDHRESQMPRGFFPDHPATIDEVEARANAYALKLRMEYLEGGK